MIRKQQTINPSHHHISRKILLEITLSLVLVSILALSLVLWLAGDSVEGLAAHLLTRDEQVIAAYLKQEGIWRGLLSVMVIEIVQVISIIIPGSAVQAAAGIIYVWWEAFLACYIGFICGHSLTFFIVRRTRAWNGKFVEKFVKSSEAEASLEDELLLPATKRGLVYGMMRKMRTSNPVFVVMLSCFTPGLPNGFIPHIAARTGITGRGFVLAVAASSWLQILCNCLAGHFLLRGNYTFMALSIIVQLIVTLLIAQKREWLLERIPSRFTISIK